MTTSTHRALRLALATAAVASALTAVVPAAPAGAVGTTTPPGLDWQPCGLPGQQCADLSVPLDHRSPDGPRISLAVSRLPSEQPRERRGTLLLIPSGPGGSGVTQLKQKGEALRKELSGAYDIVSLDPRGVGGSAQASCRLREDDRYLPSLRSWPEPDGSVSENVARSRRIAEACDRHGGPVLKSMSTANEVRDIDHFRQALGERKLSAWGVSYGSYVGAVYAQKYPRHTGRWVLDSSGDPDPERVGRGWLANMAPGADDRFPDFASWASDPAREEQELRLAEHAEDVRPLILGLAAKLDREPRESTTPDLPLNGNRLRQAVQLALYNDGSFARLARLVREAMDPDGRPALPGAIALPLPDTEAAAMMATVCNDVPWPASVPPYRQAVAADRVRHPLTAGMPVNVSACTFWKDAPADPPTRITADGPSNILMIQGLRDPATPYFGAMKMREALAGRARLVTVDRGGHGMYLANGNACGDRTVTEFLTTGRRPAQDSHCDG